ncbi:MAG: DUF2244 domain-containing protein [Pseudomonadota bacterium]
MPETADKQIVYMDAVLTPNDSLSDRAFILVMAAIAGISFVTGMMFLAMGAAPVAGFFGLDALALYLAWRWHRKRRAERTRVRITADQLGLHHTDRRGREKTAQLPSAFARVMLDTPVTHASQLRIEHGHTAYVIGRFLTPDERASLADALRGALQKARAERHGTPPVLSSD